MICLTLIRAPESRVRGNRVNLRPGLSEPEVLGGLGIVFILLALRLQEVAGLELHV